MDEPVEAAYDDGWSAPSRQHTDTVRPASTSPRCSGSVQGAEARAARYVGPGRVPSLSFASFGAPLCTYFTSTSSPGTLAATAR